MGRRLVDTEVRASGNNRKKRGDEAERRDPEDGGGINVPLLRVTLGATGTMTENLKESARGDWRGGYMILHAC